ncbi:MBL fold metallo-hydrolase [Actinoplanes sp. NPDC051470]|uniref:MBL fold metallo-hydrolase n=1 Tax=Actinoplanes sp. NPDC051470 TaxID=3157224 RepID=UPI00342717F3
MKKLLKIAVAVAAVVALSAVPADAHPTRLQVHRFASANPGSVNSYTVRGPYGSVVIDTLRTLSDAHAAVAQTHGVQAIVLTHAHPDHVGGGEVFRAAYPNAPYHATTSAITTIRTDPLGFYALTHQQLGDDYPARPLVPDRAVHGGRPLTVAGLTFQTAEFAAAETSDQIVYYHPSSQSIFVGDLVDNAMTPALLEGHTCGWLKALDQLRQRFPEAHTAYPGHGAPADLQTLIRDQRTYLLRFRGLVGLAVRTQSPGGSTVTAGEEGRIVDQVNTWYPGYQPVASIPTLMHVNVTAVAGELLSEKHGCR